MVNSVGRVMQSKTLISLIGGAALAVTGCSTNSQQKDVETNGSSYAVSCAVGAVLAGGACLLIVDEDKRAACIAAGAAGCAAGMGTNAVLDNIRSDYSNREQQLDALIAAAERSKQAAVSMAEITQKVSTELSQAFARTQKDIKRNKLSKQQLSVQVSRYDSNIRALRNNLQTHEKSLADLQTARKGVVGEERSLTAKEKQQLKECDRQIAELEHSIDEMRGALEGFNEQRDVLNLAMQQM